MEALRSQSTDQGRDGWTPPFLDEDETGREPLPMAIGRKERRLQVRAYSAWASLLGDRAFPSVAALDLDRLVDLSLNGVLLDFTASLDNPTVRHLGAALAQECGAGSIATLSDVPERSLLTQIAAHYRETLSQQAPVGFEAEFVNWRGATILYRGILLPLSSDDVRVDHVFGVINWKELADAAVSDELELHIAQTFEPLRDLQLASASTSVDGMDADLAERLRGIEARSLADLASSDGEFTLVLAHKRPNGEVTFLGTVPHDPQLLDQAARRLLDR